MDRLLIILALGVLLFVAWLAWLGAKWLLHRNVRADGGPTGDRRPALIYFSSPDCVPCRWQQAPIVEGLRQALGDRVHFEEVDALADPEKARQYHVLTVPTTVVVSSDGQVVAINYGVTQANRLSQQLARAGSPPGIGEPPARVLGAG
jgi:thioredoxin-like negative regulator of GroEL